jgi:phospholipid/cholesterol/gamma-HCH transport system substrate-binding protein
MSKEIKLGALAIVAIIASVWGYKYIKGQSLFQERASYYTSYSDVSGLEKTAAVTVNGYKVGAVTNIVINPTDVKLMDVYFQINGSYSFPKNTIVKQKADGLVGGKLLALEYSNPCSSDCAKDGDFMTGKIIGMLGSMVSEKEINMHLASAGNELKDIIGKLGAEGEPGALNSSIRRVDQSLDNINKLTASLNALTQASTANLQGTMANFNKISANIASNNAQITDIIKNLGKVSNDFGKINFSKTVDSTNQLLTESKEAMLLLQETMKTSNEFLTDLEKITTKINKGEGSLGKFVNDEEFYKNAEKALTNLNLLLQDFRLNPKRYVNISLIGRNKPYTPASEDPAIQEKDK